MKRLALILVAVVWFNSLWSGTALAQSISELASKVDRFVSDSREVYRLDDEAKEAIWTAYCGKLDPKVQNDVRYATEIGQSYQQREQDKVMRLLSDANPLTEALVRLQQVPESKDKAGRLIETLGKEVEILRKLDEGVVLKGSNHPFTQYAIEYGKKMHEEMCGRYGETPKICDKTFPSLDGRPDLVFVDGVGSGSTSSNQITVMQEAWVKVR